MSKREHSIIALWTETFIGMHHNFPLQSSELKHALCFLGWNPTNLIRATERSLCVLIRLDYNSCNHNQHPNHPGNKSKLFLTHARCPMFHSPSGTQAPSQLHPDHCFLEHLNKGKGQVTPGV